MNNSSRTEQKEREFWNWFLKNEWKYKNIEHSSFISKFRLWQANKRVKKVHRLLSVYIGSSPGFHGTDYIYISCECNPDGIPHVRSLISRFPEDHTQSWKAVPFIPPADSIDDLTIVFKEWTLYPKEIFFEIHRDSKSEKVNIHFYIDSQHVNQPETMASPLFHLLLEAVGEEIIMSKLGVIDVLPFSKEKYEDAVPFNRIKEFIG
ncbi:hypothetical protein [Metabacillus sp. SLBN-84]